MAKPDPSATKAANLILGTDEGKIDAAITRLRARPARRLVKRMGEGTVRLAYGLDRLALWAGGDGEVSVADLEAMIADTSEEATWALSDAIVVRDPAAALAAAERLLSQGEAVTPLV